MTTKSRSWRPTLVQGIKRSNGLSAFVPYSDIGPLSTETLTGSSNHKVGGHWSGGGYFNVSRDSHYYQPESNFHRKVAGGVTLLEEGTTRILSPTSGVVDLPQFSTMSQSQLLAKGTTAIARTEPTSPAFDLSVALGEILAEGLPMAPGSSVMERTNLANKAGSEYINQEFGWLPLVRGIRDFSSTVSKSDEILRKYQEKANIPIKRRYDFPSLQATQWNSSNFTAVNAMGSYLGGGRFTTATQTIWFEGSFIYHLPVGSSADARMRRFGANARKLLGVDLSPEVLWNLAPWSWAVDWVTNTGDVLHNVSAMGTDGMVLRYGHVMCHTRYVQTDTGTHTSGVPMVHTRIRETKTRYSATPFGFGTVFSGLSSKQLAILSALGLSRW